MILPYSVTGSGPMVCHALRLRRGDDLKESIEKLCREQHIRCGVILSAVGCILAGQIRDAGGVRVHEIRERCEIVGITGTVSENRCHIHISLSREDLSVIGGHLCPGCIVNTTCELVIGEIPGMAIEKEFDEQTGYHELVFRPLS